MQKPEGKAEAGWYDHPTDIGFEKYWNGKFWTKKNRLIGEEGPVVIPANVKYLGRFLFRYPIGSDGAFIGYLITVGFGVFFALKQELSSGVGLALIINAILGSVVTIPWVYILFLIFLVPRRIIDKKRGIKKYSQNSEIDVENKGRVSQSKIAIIFVGVLLLIALAIFGLTQTNKSAGDKWFEEEQRISIVVGEWNQGVAPFVTLIQGISNGQVGVGEAQEKAASINSTVGPILIKLREECSDVPNETVTGKDEERAFLLAWKMLRVVCDVIPQQYTETFAVYKAQISDTATQADIDYHVAQLAALGQRKKDAVIEALNAISPYVSEADLENIQRLKAALGV